MSTIKVTKDLIKLLDRFRAYLLRKYGIKIDEKEIVGNTVKWAVNNEKFIKEEFLKKKKKDVSELLEKPIDWGIEDSSADIDEHLYGNK